MNRHMVNNECEAIVSQKTVNQLEWLREILKVVALKERNVLSEKCIFLMGHDSCAK